MEDDLDIFAYLCAARRLDGDLALIAFSMDENSSRRVGPLSRAAARPQETKTGRDGDTQSREATEEPEDGGDGYLESSECLRLRFSEGASTRHGLVVGRGPLADIRLPRAPGISSYHFALDFDDQNRLIVRDLVSTYGISVVYAGETPEWRRDYSWIVGGHAFLNDKVPTIQIAGNLHFKLIVPTRDTQSQAYVDGVAMFRQRAATVNSGDLLTQLSLQSASKTELPTHSGERTSLRLGSGPVLWRREIGRGSFGMVTYVWNTTIGDEYALKEPSKKPKARDEMNRIKKNWEKELTIMGRIRHVSPPSPSLSLHPCARSSRPVQDQELTMLDVRSTLLFSAEPRSSHGPVFPSSTLMAGPSITTGKHQPTTTSRSPSSCCRPWPIFTAFPPPSRIGILSRQTSWSRAGVRARSVSNLLISASQIGVRVSAHSVVLGSTWRLRYGPRG